jgi:hypothetical protein
MSEPAFAEAAVWWIELQSGMTTPSHPHCVRSSPFRSGPFSDIHVPFSRLKELINAHAWASWIAA